MRLIAALLLLPVAASAAGLDEAGGPGFCLSRSYPPDHLARHPDQRVVAISLKPSADPAGDMAGDPAGDPAGAEGHTALEVAVTLREASAPLVATAYCTVAGADLACLMEGDAGDFSVAPRPDGALLTVGEQGMTFEGASAFETLKPHEGDDRTFRLGPC